MPGVVTVACKLPTGLVLRGFKMETRVERARDGSTRDVQIAVETGKQVKINGNSTYTDRAPTCKIVAGYALTEGVDADFFNNWMKENAESPLVTKHLIFGYEKTDKVESVARENEKRRSGIEPLDRTKMPRGLAPADSKD